MEEKLATWVYQTTVKSQHHSQYDKAKIIYGWTVMFYNLFKIVLILLFSLLLYSLEETLACYIPFCLVRITGFGYHAKNNLICNLSGVFLFSIIPFVIGTFIDTRPTRDFNIFLIPFFLISLFLIYKFAPSYTSNSYTSEQKKTKKLRNWCIAIFILLAATSLILSTKTGILMNYGTGIAVLFLLPNYFKGEKYE